MTIRNNQEIIGKSLNTLSQGLYPYVVKEIEANYPNEWVETARTILSIPKKSDLEKTLSEDVSLQLKLILKKWDDVFKKNNNLSKKIVEELIEVANKWAHGTLFSIDETYSDI